ncbi:MAG: succinate dehydrogenase cytochrome b subunit [Leptospirales bacterium]|nr:succinate dehydrogenase cytochrome b subunit [Leptospirales bacterium]
MILAKKIFGSSIGKKAVMAITGGGLVLFLTGHLAGNLLVFAGPDAINEYGHKLRSLPALLWTVRLGLLAFFLSHVMLGISLTLANRRARGSSYAYNNTVQASIASRTMIYSGLVILFYVIYHLLHFTMGVAHSEYSGAHDQMGRADIYRMVVLSFQQWPIAACYVVAMFFLALHLSHGIPSLFQSLGWNSPRFDRIYKRVGLILSIVYFVGYTSIPASVWLGIVKLP